MKFNRPAFSLIFAILSLTSTSCQQRPLVAPGERLATLKSKIDAVVDVQIQDGLTPGAVVGIYKDGQLSVWGYGETAIGSGVRPDGKTLYEIGSISKVFSGTLLADTALKGRVALNSTVESVLPELTDTDAGKTTFLQLATHTSGFPRMPSNFPAANPLDPYADYTDSLLLNFLKGLKVDSRPTTYNDDQYSNLGVGLEAYALTRVWNTPYETLLRQVITDPLQLHDTVVTLSPDQEARTAKPYNDLLDDGHLWNLNVLVGAGGIRSTANDMLKFLVANIDEDASPLGQAMAESHGVRVSFNGSNNGIGLNWFTISKFGNTEGVIGHGGATGGYRASAYFHKPTRTGVVVLNNSANPVQCAVTLVFGGECSVAPEFKHSDIELDSYTGV